MAALFLAAPIYPCDPWTSSSDRAIPVAIVRPALSALDAFIRVGRCIVVHFMALFLHQSPGGDPDGRFPDPWVVHDLLLELEAFHHTGLYLPGFGI